MEESTLAGLLIKLVVCPAVVLLSAYVLFADVYYPSLYQPIVVGLVLAIAAHMMEVFMLRPGTLWISTAMDFVAATVIVYFSEFFFTGARITFVGAMLTAFLLSITEYFQHKWLIQSGRTEKA